MSHLKVAIIICALCLYINAFGDSISNACQESYDNKEWKKAQINCELQFKNDNSTHKPLLLLNQLVQINAQLDNKDDEGFYLYLMKSHENFSTDLLHQYLWNRRMGQISFYQFNYDKRPQHNYSDE